METKKSNAVALLIALIIGASIIISSYFIALGFRYETIGNIYILDKWNKQIYLISGEKFKKLED